MFKTNEYFDGKVKSIAFDHAGQAATIGVMAPGDYTFNTSTKEEMSVITGSLIVKLADQETRTYHKGDSFQVAENTSFEVTAHSETSYLCLYD